MKLSQDGVALLLHDETLERTTNGRGRAADLPWEKLRTLDAGGVALGGVSRRAPALLSRTAAKLLQSKGTLANVEIKPTPGFDRETGARVAELTRQFWQGAAATPLLSSFSFEALMAARQAAPEIRARLARRMNSPRWIGSGSRRWRRFRCTPATRHCRQSASPRLQARGYRVMLYTVNDIATAEKLLDAGVDGMFTDNLRDFAARFPTLI